MKRKIFTMILGFLLPIDLFAGTGDVNVDGVLDSADIQALINYLMNGQTKGFNMAEADANNDGFVNVSDVTKIIHSMTDKNEVVVLNMAALKQKGNANTTGLSAFDAQKISKLHLKITMPQAGDFKAVILETDGRLVTKKTYNKVINKMVSNDENSQAESAIETMFLDGVSLSKANQVLNVYLPLLPVDLSARTLKVRVYDSKGNVFPVTQELGKRKFVAGGSYDYTLQAEAAECSGLPLLFINTVNRKTIDSKEVWQEGTSCSIVSTDGSMLDAPAKVKGRGNNTWAQPKKPYTVKFSEKQKPFGFPKNKSWALLADYYDHSLLRTAFMSSVSRAAGIEWTINYQHVNLYLNGEYHGVYVFTDKVEESSNRVQVKKDGFFIEDDTYYEHEKVYFVSSMGNGFTFKYPDADEDIVKGDDNYLFIKNYVNQAEAAMKQLEKEPNNTKYQTYIDITSFAKYHIACAAMLLFDSNRYYVLPSRQAKLKMLPMWDSEWSLGLRPKAWGKTTWSLVEDTSLDRAFYFKYLMKSPAFKKAVKQEWAKFKTNAHQVKDEIETVRQLISTAQAANFKMWPPKTVNLNYSFDTWEKEVEYILQFFDDRLEWLEGHYDSF